MTGECGWLRAAGDAGCFDAGVKGDRLVVSACGRECRTDRVLVVGIQNAACNVAG